MAFVPDHLPKPQSERISALTAMVLLTYGLIRMIILPSVETEVAIFGLLVKIEFKTQSIMLILTAALAAAGTDWLIQGHPKETHSRLAIENWIIPAMAAVAIGVIVIRIPEGPALWIGLLLGAILLVAILTAEFIVFDTQDPRFGNVATVLTSLALLLLLSSFLTIQVLEVRAFFAIPLTFLASFVVAWRLIKLAIPGRRAWTWAVLIGFIVSQLALGLHYWPISPLRRGFLLGLIAYLSYQGTILHLNQELDRTSHMIEIVVVSVLSLLAILLLT
jgi:hypothetical protein